MTSRIEVPNQEKIKILGEKETYKYLGILEDTKGKWRKKKLKKSISRDWENDSKPNSIAEISSKG